MRPILKHARDTVKQCKVVPLGSCLRRELGRVSSSVEQLDSNSLLVVWVESPPDLVVAGFSCGFDGRDVNRHTRYNFDGDEGHPVSESWIPITYPLVIPRPDRQIHLVPSKAWNLANKMIVRRYTSFVLVSTQHKEMVNSSQAKTTHPPASTNVGHAASPNFERAASRAWMLRQTVFDSRSAMTMPLHK